MTNDPWKDITPPNAANAFNAKRIDADVQWGFFWAKGIDGKCLFVIQHTAASTPSARLPRLQGIEISDREWIDENSRILIFTLEDAAQRELFHQLCLDIVSFASGAGTEREAVLLAIARTWRWHHLLRGGGDRRLSPEEQKGLIGELLVIERHLLPNLNCINAVEAWHGPLGSPKDFEIGHTCIEVKARRGAATPYVAISSECQLDGSGIHELFLYVVDLDRAPDGSENSFSLANVATRIQQAIVVLDSGVLETFEGLLTAAGFRWADDYSDMLWVEGKNRVYRVSDGFPRITADQLASGVGDVRYSISLVSCHSHLVDAMQLERAVRGNCNGR